MISYLDRDLVRNFLISFIAIVAFVKVGFFVSVLLEKYQYVFGGGDSKAAWVLLYYLFSIPRQFSFTIPIGTAVSILYVFTIKARNNEILAALAGGISPIRLAAPLIVLGFLFSLSGFLVSEFVANPSDTLAARIERRNILEKPEGTSQTNVFQKGEGSRFYNILTFDPSNDTMDGPVIVEMRPDYSSIAWRLEAQSAINNGSDLESEWFFYQATLRHYDSSGAQTSYAAAERMSEKQLPAGIEVGLNRYLKERLQPARMGALELLEYIELFERQSKPTYNLRTYLHFNIAIPLGALVLTILMCGHILRPSATGYMVGFGGGLVLMGLYYLTIIGGFQLSKRGVIDPALCAWIPTVLFGVLGVALLNRTRAI